MVFKQPAPNKVRTPAIIEMNMASELFIGKAKGNKGIKAASPKDNPHKKPDFVGFPTFFEDKPNRFSIFFCFVMTFASWFSRAQLKFILMLQYMNVQNVTLLIIILQYRNVEDVEPKANL